MNDTLHNGQTVNRPQHPLCNPDSSHYKLFDTETITQLEKLFSREELMSWAKISYYKYMFRLGKKDPVDKELAKMDTFKAYYYHLETKEAEDDRVG